MTYMKVLIYTENNMLIVFKSSNLDYNIDKCLYISCSYSGLIIGRFSPALEWKCQNQIPEGLYLSMLHILDDIISIMTQTEQKFK